MILTVIRSFSAGDFRFRYSLYKGSNHIARVLTDTEARLAVVTLDPTPQMKLRRDASELSKREIEDPDTHIVTITTT
jgi:23S rRNA A2030 N6-methylase RlmJ